MIRPRWRPLVSLLALILLTVSTVAARPARQPLATTKAFLPLVQSARPLPYRFTVSEQLRWFNPAARPKSYDVVIVADFSTAARFCWDTLTPCAEGQRRIDGQADAIRRIVYELLVTRNNQDADNRVGLVTYGHLDGNFGTALKRVRLHETRAQSLAAFAQIVGTQAQPRVIPDSELIGQAALPEAMETAAEVLYNHRRYVDANGQPVNHLTVVFIAGVPNVFVDAPFLEMANTCGADPSAERLYDPSAQYLCPQFGFRDDHPHVRAPLRAAVQQADLLRDHITSRNQVSSISALALGAGPAPEALRLHMLAPEHFARAATPAAVAQWAAATLDEVGRPCMNGVDAVRPAAGAQIRIADQAGTVVFSGTADLTGMVTATLHLGAYQIAASHGQQASPNDPRRPAVRMDYGQLITDEMALPAATAPLTLTEYNYWVPQPLLLTPNDPVAVRCP